MSEGSRHNMGNVEGYIVILAEGLKCSIKLALLISFKC